MSRIRNFRTFDKRFWTDYERTNRTHFWSETAKVWWSSENYYSQFTKINFTDFGSYVSCDGYKKLRNDEPIDGASCICVGSCLSFQLVMTSMITAKLKSWIIFLRRVLFGPFSLLNDFFVELERKNEFSRNHASYDIRRAKRTMINTHNVAYELKYW